MPRFLQALVAARPEAATALAMQLCSPGSSGGARGGDSGYVAAASDFAHIYADRCSAIVIHRSGSVMHWRGKVLSSRKDS